MTSPTKGKYGYLVDVCDKCGESELPLVRVGKEKVCDTCAKFIDKRKSSIRRNREIDKDVKALDKILHSL